jgi:hypothetical protein
MSEEDERPFPLYTEDELEQLGRLGDEHYARLKATVEPGNEGRFIAIHVDTGEYAIGKTASEASRALRAGREPDGRTHVQKIGDEPDYVLAPRILAGKLAGGARK